VSSRASDDAEGSAVTSILGRGGVRGGMVLATAGTLGAVLAAVFDHGDAGSAANQDWPPFVLVSGLLLVGLVADESGLFAAAGRALARV
jgi:hypothetical protein